MVYCDRLDEASKMKVKVLVAFYKRVGGPLSKTFTMAKDLCEWPKQHLMHDFIAKSKKKSRGLKRVVRVSTIIFESSRGYSLS